MRRSPILSTLLAPILLAFVSTGLVSRARATDPDEQISVTRTIPDNGPFAPGELIFFEDFNIVNFSLWQPIITMSGCGSGEFQIYDKNPENIFVKDSILHIQPTLTADKYGEDFLYDGNLVLKGCTDPLYNGCNKTATGDGFILNPVISARLRTQFAFSFLYGRVEARAKLPAGDWIWPAIWMNPTKSKYGSWPQSGEVDIMESRGNRFLFDGKWVNVGNKQASATLHFGPNRQEDKWRTTAGYKNNYLGYDQDFHLFQYEWTPEQMTFSIDNEVLKVISPPKDGGMYKWGGFKGHNIWENATNPQVAPFDQFFYFIINVAVGGQRGYFNENHVNIPFDNVKPWKNSDTLEQAMLDFWNAKDKWYPTWEGTSAMQLDYIKVWAI
ncbi:unnamed protein product [Allacma fusca]|uniref:GH16 domain-containing protein n=1 Tax=Allacma fusca TaxID=39272 RepID=A0A8J2PNK7_9HEXA|nr:unnamed protein product [Allacma fusca]